MGVRGLMIQEVQDGPPDDPKTGSFRFVASALTRVPGIAQVTVFGAGQYAMRLWVKPAQLATLNITVPEIISAAENFRHYGSDVVEIPLAEENDFDAIMAMNRKIRQLCGLSPTEHLMEEMSNG